VVKLRSVLLGIAHWKKFKRKSKGYNLGWCSGEDRGGITEGGGVVGRTSLGRKGKRVTLGSLLYTEGKR